jgi:hypothetical protein
MRLDYSRNGVPFIELKQDDEDYGTLIFSSITKTDAGYKYMCFSHRYEDQVKIKKGNGYEFVKMEVNDSFVFNMRMKRDEAGIRGVPTGTMPRRLVDWIIATFDPFLIDGVMPFSAIEKLRPILETANIDKILDTKIKRAYKKKETVKEPPPSGKLTDLF